jgi:hypothetical protein
LAFGAAGVMPIQLRIQGEYDQIDLKKKYSDSNGDSTAKLQTVTQTVSVAGALKNGFGLILSLKNVSEKLNVEGGTKDANYGYILPTLYYGNETNEVTFTYLQSMRHDSGTTNGHFELTGERKMDSFNLLGSIVNNRRSENVDYEDDNFEFAGGARVFVGENRSNLITKMKFKQPYYRRPSDASVYSVASQQLDVIYEYFYDKQWVIDSFFSYAMASGTGAEVKGSKEKINATELNVAVMATYRM